MLYEKLLLASLAACNLGGEEKLCELLQACVPDIAVLSLAASRLRTAASGLSVRGQVQGIGAWHRLRDQVLSGALQDAINNALQAGKEDWKVPVQVDASRFFELCEENLLTLQELTHHQKEKLRDISRLANVHLSAPAGAGKTFVAVQRVLDVLDSGAHVLYVAPTKELIHYFVYWIITRLGSRSDPEALSTSSIQGILSRMLVLHKPYEVFLSVVLEDGSIDLQPAVDIRHFKLTVIDESHNIFRENESQGKLGHVEFGDMLLLSDESQSFAVADKFPRMQRVKLTQVVRSAKRIVAGAAAFQSTAESVTSVGTDGPPLKLFLFDASSFETDLELVEEYARHVSDAFLHLVNAFRGISLHKRVALLLPDARFLDQLEPLLHQALCDKFPHRHFDFVRFVDSLRSLPERLRSFGAPTTEGLEEVILDTVDAADGLEQLIVICVGLDAVIGGNSSDLAVRAKIYKGITRAQLLVIIVNKRVENGWFEFLRNVKYSSDELSGSDLSPQPCDAAAKICQQARISDNSLSQPASLEEQGPTHEGCIK